MKTVLVTGSYGQLGSAMETLSINYPDLKFAFYDVDRLDITNENAVLDLVAELKPAFIVNCAAYTAVDDAEENLDLATKINVDGPRNLARAAKAVQGKLIHISTDYVFNGDSWLPYKETDAVDPIGAYGLTKLNGELAVFEADPASIVIRTSWLYSQFGKNFVKTILRVSAGRDEMGVIYDQVGTPTNAMDLADAILQICISEASQTASGVYHYSNEGAVSWYDFASAIVEIAGINCKIKPLETFEYPAKTKRPHYSVLNKRKIRETFDISIPYWRDSLIKCIDLLK